MRALVIGDVMVDRYTYVRTTRRASEAPIPIWDVVGVEQRLGGAANVARNLKAIGKEEIEVVLAGIVGRDRGFCDLADAVGVKLGFCVGSTTMVKHRYVEHESLRHLFRIDSATRFPSDDSEYFGLFIGEVGALDRFDAIIISDYDKGTVTERVAEIVRENRPRLVVVDSKRRDLSLYDGFEVLKVNDLEYLVQSSGLSGVPYPCVERLFDYVVVTKGAAGAELRQCEKAKTDGKRYVVHSEFFPVESVQKVVDVTGCGDTHTAAMAFSLLKNGDVRAAVRFANVCAREVVQKFGTSVV